MGLIHSILTNFTAGELSPRLYGRVDLAKYQNGARELTNMVVLPQGGARKRGGSQYIARVRGDAAEARLVEFTFSTTQSYMLEVGSGYIRFFKDRGAIFDRSATITGISQGNPAVVTAAGHGFVDGQSVVLTGVVGMSELNNREFRVAGAGANTFQLYGVNSTNYRAYVSGGSALRILELATIFNATDVANMNFTQSADTLYIFTDRWPIQKLMRSSHTSWTLTTANVEEGPFLDMNTDDANSVSIDVASGVGVMTFSKDFLEEAHTGALFKIWEYANGSSFGYATWAPGATVIVANGSFWEYKGNVYYVVSGGGAQMASTASYPTHTRGTASVFYGQGGESAQMRYEHSGYAVVQVQEVVDTKNAWVEVVKNRTPYSAYGARSTLQWQEGAWSDKRGYPRTGAFHNQRLNAANTEYQPSTFWGSVVGAYLKFKESDKDDEAYRYTIASDQVDAISYMLSTKRLNLLTTSKEYVVGVPTDKAITPTNIKVSPETSFGSAYVRPVRAGPAILFAQRAGKNENPAHRLREFVYNFQTDSFTAPDLTILAEHITDPGLVSGAFIPTPDMVVWYARADGAMVGLTYERDQQVVGWHKHIIGGSGAKVTRLASIPGDNSDELWMIVERRIGNQTVRYIEVLTQGLPEGAEFEDCTFLDSCLSYDGGTRNLVTWSQSFDRWNKFANGTGVLPRFLELSAPAPDGTLTAQTVFFDTVNGVDNNDNSVLYSNEIAFTIGQTYNYSFYVRGQPGQVISAVPSGENPTPSRWIWTLEDDGWHRLSATFTSAVGTTHINIGIGAVYALNSTVTLWGFQVEKGNTRTAYSRNDATVAAGAGPATEISGLYHLEGEAVDALADGAPVKGLIVSGGRITVPNPATKIVAGAPYTSRVKTLHLEAGAQAGTAQGAVGRVFQLIARVQNSLGGRFGPEQIDDQGNAMPGKLDPIDFRAAVTPLSDTLPLFTGDKVLPFGGPWDRNRYAVIEHDDPVPFTLTALVVGQVVQG